MRNPCGDCIRDEETIFVEQEMLVIYTSYAGVVLFVFKGRMLTASEHKNLSLLQKLAAILGLSSRFDYCPKHKLFFEKCESGRVDELWVCPKCFDEKAREFLLEERSNAHS